MGFAADLLKNVGHQSLKTAKIGIRTPLQSDNYFRFVSQTISVEATTFLSRVQNLVKISKRIVDVIVRRPICSQTHRRKNDYWVYPMHWIDKNVNKPTTYRMMLLLQALRVAINSTVV